MNKPKQPNPKKIWIISLSITVVVALLIWLAYAVIPYTIFSGVTNFYMPNYAKDIAKPIDDALVKAGGVKVCENATNGREPSNMKPSYNARYQFDKSNEETTQILQHIASKNGYSLTPVPSNYESIHHFEDVTSKQSQHADLEAGNVEFRFSTYSNTNDKGLICSNNKKLLGDESHTGVSFSLGLPLFKHN